MPGSSLWSAVKRLWKLLGLIQTFLWIGGATVITAIVSWLSHIPQPWVSVFAVGVCALSLATILVLFANLPTDWYLRKGIKARVARPSAPLPAPYRSPLAFPTIPQQVTSLIEEALRLHARIPLPSDDTRTNLVRMLTGDTHHYPALVFEWEARVWRLLSSAGLQQYRGLFTHSDLAQSLPTLRDYLAERIAELRTILARL